MSEHPAQIRIRTDIAASPVVLYMEGTPMFPFDGPSAAISQCLALLGIQPTCFNLLDEPDLREGLVRESQCEDLPQLYILGTFYGGGATLRTAVKEGQIKNYLVNAGLLQA